LPEERGLYKKMQVRRVLRYYGQLKGRSTAELDPVIAQWLARLQLADWADKRVDQLSKGMAQKVQFISAIVSKPDTGHSRRAVFRPRPGERRVAARRRARAAP
jgi:ABC-2 type transport system ATP-binding protein